MHELYTCDYCNKNLDQLKNVYVSGNLSVFCSKKCAETHEYEWISPMSLYDYEKWLEEIGYCQFCHKSLNQNKNVYVTKDLSVCCSKKCAKNYVKTTIGKMSLEKYINDCSICNGY